MKKVSLLTALLVTAGISTVSADVLMGGCPKAFQGFHLSTNVGYAVGYDKVNVVDGAVGPDQVTVSNKLGVSGIDGGIGTGYTYRCGNWAFGLAFDANWANSSGKHTYAETDGDNLSHKTRMKNALQLYGRTGYVIADKVMPFVGLGWENAQWSHKYTDNDTVNFSKKKRFNALMWKAGVDFLMTKHVVMGVEYTGSSASRKTLQVAEETTAKFKPQYNKFAATLKFVF